MPMKATSVLLLVLFSLCGGDAFVPNPPSRLSSVSLSRTAHFAFKTDEAVETSTAPAESAVSSSSVAAATADQSESSGSETLGADLASEEYKRGFAIIGFITLLNASLAPVWHTAFSGAGAPPPLLLNAAVSVVALIGLLAGGPFLDKNTESMSALADSNEEKWSMKSFRGGAELGLWKFLGTTCHLYGLSLTTANHGAFLIQLTTLIVPVIQGIQGEKIPKQIQLAVALALGGIFAFTQDPSGSAQSAQNIPLGDALCVACAFFYSFYDIQTFYWGREVPRTELVTIKIGMQAVFSCLLCAVLSFGDVESYFSTTPDYDTLIPVVLWSGLIVNALATFLQVGGMQAVGPTRAQTIFASQPLWAALLNLAFLGETVGPQGLVGGGAFLGALYLAATSDAPKPKIKTEAEA